MKKNLISSAVIWIVLAFSAQPALPWGAATHAFLMDHIGKTAYLKNVNEIYGSMATDTFNLMPASDLRDYMWEKTHHGFMDVWDAATWAQKPSAYGFVGHNDSWGADFTAHHRSRLYWIDGYVIVKAKLLEGIFNLSDQLNIPKLEAIDLWHNLVEVAGDIVIWRNDPNIGDRIKYAALLRTPQFPQLLVDAYGIELDANTALDEELNNPPYYTNATEFIHLMEEQFRQVMFAYGDALDKNSEAEIIEAFAALASLYYELPPAATPEALKQLLELSLLFIQGDYMREINRTTNFVKIELLAHWIFYF